MTIEGRVNIIFIGHCIISATMIFLHFRSTPCSTISFADSDLSSCLIDHLLIHAFWYEAVRVCYCVVCGVTPWGGVMGWQPSVCTICAEKSGPVWWHGWHDEVTFSLHNLYWKEWHCRRTPWGDNLGKTLGWHLSVCITLPQMVVTHTPHAGEPCRHSVWSDDRVGTGVLGISATANQHTR